MGLVMKATTNAPSSYLNVIASPGDTTLPSTTGYQTVKSPNFPMALVHLRDRNDQPCSMGFWLGDVVTYE